MIKKGQILYRKKMQMESGCAKLFGSDRQFTVCVCVNVCVCENSCHVQKQKAVKEKSDA